MFVIKKMIKNLLTGFSPMFKKRWLIPALLLAVLIISFTALHKLSPAAISYTPINPDVAHEINFFALGDQGTGEGDQMEVARAMEQVAERNKNLNFVILLGDNFYIDEPLTVKSPAWKKMFEEVYTGAYLNAVPFYAILGNHDDDLHSGSKIHPEIEYSRKALGSKRWHMPDSYYHYDFGIANGRPLLRLVFIDTNVPADKLQVQVDYIRKQFTENPVQPVWKAVVGHHTLRSYGKHYADKSDIAPMLIAAMKNANVDFYLSGHDHNQQLIVKDKEPVYIVDGAGGRKLSPQKASSKDLRFFREGFGFVGLSVNAAKLNIDFYNSGAAKVASHEIDRSCMSQRASCVKEMNK